jgi:uncharacterized membrane protein
MEDFFLVILVIAVLWLIVERSGAKSQLEDFRQQIASLRDRVTTLELSPKPEAPRPAQSVPTLKTEASKAAVVPAPVAPPVPKPTYDPAYPGFARQSVSQPTAPLAAPRPTPPPPAFTPPPVAVAPSEPQRSLSLEERLGQNWLNKLGIVALVIGLALLLGRELRNLGPVGRSSIGLTLSAAILTTGLFLERRERYRIFARALIGGGWAMIFFVTFALYHLNSMQVIHSQTLDLILMLAVATAMVAHSLRYRSQVVTSLAFLLAFVTVGLSQVTLFSLVAGAILAVGLIAVAYRMCWFELALAGLVGVYLNHFLWLHRVLPNGAVPGHPFPTFLPSAALLIIYWLLFRLFYIFSIPETDTQRFSATGNMVLNTVGLLSLLKYQSSHPEWAFYGLLVLGIAELTLAFVARRRHHNAFVALVCISSLFLVAAIPFRFGGATWPLLWLLEAEVLFAAALAMQETVFRRLSYLAAFAALLQTFAMGVFPVLELRQMAPDNTHHLHLSIVLFTAAICFWANSEFATRRWTVLRENVLDNNALQAFSYLAVVALGTALWLIFPNLWTVLPWLAAALGLAFAADMLRSPNLALQTDILAFAAILRLGGIHFLRWDSFPTAPRTVIVVIATAMLYALMRRSQQSFLLRTEHYAAVYSWAGAGSLTLLLWYTLPAPSTTVAWGFLGLLLLELGLATEKDFFQQQATALLVSSFLRIGFVNLDLEPTQRLYTVLPLAAAYAWSYERLHASSSATAFKRITSATFAWLALATLTTLLYFQLSPMHVAIGGAVLTVALLALAYFLRRPLFTAQALVLLVMTAGRALAFNMFLAPELASPFPTSRLFTVGLTCAILLAALPIAFAIRKQSTTPPANDLSRYTLHHPEQLLFFVPLGLIVALLFVQLRAGMITVGWSALGVVTFLFALTVGERSFRLAGLGLLMLGVVKILAVDIWNAAPTDRYITLIVMGAALLSVSFLYSRYRETILKLL